MVAKNDITGDSIISRHSKQYEENIERIFGDKSEEKARKAKEKEEYFAKLAAETKARMENTSGTRSEYYDILSTEDCLTDD
jgi:lauroyl/myristoyl acyltransferase